VGIAGGLDRIFMRVCRMAKGPLSALFSLRNGGSMVPLSGSLSIKLWRAWSGY